MLRHGPSIFVHFERGLCFYHHYHSTEKNGEKRTFIRKFFYLSELLIMQQVSPTIIQTRYPPPHHQYPFVSVGNSQSLKSVDPTVFGPSAPPVKSSKLINNQINDVDLRRLILFNLPIDLVQEYLELYLEHLSGETEIERIDYSNLEDTTIMVTFKTELS